MSRLEIDLDKNWSLTNTRFDKEVLLAAIIQKGATFEPIYTDPNFLYAMSNLWWKKWQRTFEAWFDEFDLEYNHLENWDKRENWSEGITDEGYSNTETSNTEIIDDDTTGSRTVTETTDDETTNSQTTTSEVDTSGSTSDTVTNSVSAFDAGNTLVTHDQQTSSGTSSSSEDGTSSTSGTTTDDKTVETVEGTATTDDRTTTNNGSSENSNGNERQIEHEYYGHGNIGVLYASQMQMMDIAKDYWNEYNHMADIFLREFCVRVY